MLLGGLSFAKLAAHGKGMVTPLMQITMSTGFPGAEDVWLAAAAAAAAAAPALPPPPLVTRGVKAGLGSLRPAGAAVVLSSGVWFLAPDGSVLPRPPSVSPTPGAGDTDRFLSPPAACPAALPLGLLDSSCFAASSCFAISNGRCKADVPGAMRVPLAPTGLLPFSFAPVLLLVAASPACFGGCPTRLCSAAVRRARSMLVSWRLAAASCAAVIAEGCRQQQCNNRDACWC